MSDPRTRISGSHTLANGVFKVLLKSMAYSRDVATLPSLAGVDHIGGG